MTYPHDDRRNDSYPRDRAPDPRNEETELLPEADYAVTATAHRFGWSSNKTPQIGISLKIVDGPHKGKRLLWYSTFANAQAEEITIKGLRALGMRGNDIIKDIHTIYEGGQAIAVVAHETYDNKVRAKVKWLNGADVIMKDEMDANDLAAFAQRMRGAFARNGGGSAPAPSGHARGPNQGAPPSRGAPPRDDRRPPQREQRSFNDAPPPNDDDAPWTGR